MCINVCMVILVLKASNACFNMARSEAQFTPIANPNPTEDIRHFAVIIRELYHFLAFSCITGADSQIVSSIETKYSLVPRLIPGHFTGYSLAHLESEGVHQLLALSSVSFG